MTYATLVKNLCKMKIIRDDFTSIEEQSSQVIMTDSHQVTDFYIDTKRYLLLLDPQGYIF